MAGGRSRRATCQRAQVARQVCARRIATIASRLALSKLSRSYGSDNRGRPSALTLSAVAAMSLVSVTVGRQATARYTVPMTVARVCSASSVLLLLLITSCRPTPRTAPMPVMRATGVARDTIDITLLHTNDMHGQLSGMVVDTGDASAQTGDRGRSYQEFPRAGAIGGIARVATVVARIRAERGTDHVVLVDAGDTFGDGLLANLTRGAATLRCMNALGYQFMALGNHDFEYGANRTLELQSGVHFPMRAANAVDRVSGVPFGGDPDTVFVIDHVRVGVLALAYHNTDQTGNTENTRDLRFVSGIETARRLVPLLRRRADVIVVVSHQGTLVDSMLAGQVAGIDVIIGGHSHDRVVTPRRVGQTWLAQASSDATAVGELRLRVVNGTVTGVTGTLHELYADQIEPQSRFSALLDSIRAPYRDTLDAVIAQATSRIGRQYKSESPVDHLAAELLREWAYADVAFLPGLGFGETLQAGPITREMLVGLFPHPTAVVHMELTGAQIVAVLEQSATNLRPALAMDRVGGLIQTAGLQYSMNLTRPVGARVMEVFVGQAIIEPERLYRVVTTGGLLQGTHRQRVFSQGVRIWRDAQPVVQVLEALMRAKGSMGAPAMGAVRMVQ